MSGSSTRPARAPGMPAPRDGIYHVSLSDPSSASSSEKPAGCGRRKWATEKVAAGGRRKSATGHEEQQKAKKMPKKSATGGPFKIRGSVGLALQCLPKTMQDVTTHSKATSTAMEKPCTQKPVTCGNTSSHYSDESDSSAMEKPLTQKPASGGNTSSSSSDESSSSAELRIASPAKQKQGIRKLGSFRDQKPASGGGGRRPREKYEKMPLGVKASSISSRRLAAHHAGTTCC